MADMPDAPFPRTATPVNEGPMSIVTDIVAPPSSKVPAVGDMPTSAHRSIRAGICQPGDWTTVLPTHIDHAGFDLLLLPERADIGGGDYLSAHRWLNHFEDLLPTIGFRLETISIRDQDWTELRQRSQVALSQGTLPAFLLEFESRPAVHQVVAGLVSWLTAEHLRVLSAADLADLLSRGLLGPDPSGQSSPRHTAEQFPHMIPS
jgi:hypothetical protein